ncbi:hypothetical protein BSLG_002990 [Batrachochytrium salamandrivorans]|nr:hypothetical protein BSLG_002990 [Batrachochytrium salamandrivorans]
MASQNVLFSGSNSGAQQGYYPASTQEELSFQQFTYGDGSSQGFSGGAGSSVGQQSGGFYNDSTLGIPGEFPSRYVGWVASRQSVVYTGLDRSPITPYADLNMPDPDTMGLHGLTVMNPFRQIDRHIMDDTDLAGPILFCFLFGGFLFLSGKAHFGYIYGVATLGWLSMYAILNLMSETGIDGYRTASVLGYALLPMVILSSLTIFFKMQDFIGIILSALTVTWCTSSSSGMFVTVLSMKEQRLLVAYPVALLYSAFALLAVF